MQSRTQIISFGLAHRERRTSAHDGLSSSDRCRCLVPNLAGSFGLIARPLDAEGAVAPLLARSHGLVARPLRANDAVAPFLARRLGLIARPPGATDAVAPLLA